MSATAAWMPAGPVDIDRGYPEQPPRRYGLGRLSRPSSVMRDGVPVRLVHNRVSQQV